MIDPADLAVRGIQLGRYTLLRRLAVGGMAELFLAEARGVEGFAKVVALKRILPQFAANTQFVKMFLHEARLVARLDHPNIAQVYDIGQSGETYFFTMEYVHGEDLRRLLNHAFRVGRGLPLEHCVSIGIGAAAGLHHAHEQVDDQGRLRRIVHRDVTPSNIRVSYNGHVKLLDFGVAKAETSGITTSRDHVKGSVSYMSPEQCRGEDIDRRSDIFAMGILLWNHWFFNESSEQDKVRADFGAAHAGESHYGGLPYASFTGIRQATPAHLQAFLQHNSHDVQPNQFDSIMIDQQMANSGGSSMWDGLYAKSVAGDEIATPHWAVTPSSQPLLTQMINAYQGVLNGTQSPDTLPDITQTIPETEWPDMSIRPKAGLDARGIMNHMCRHCHNNALDQSITRASFNVDNFDSLPRMIKDKAIDRLQRPADDRRRMPPVRFHELTDAARDLVIQELSR